MNNLIDKHMLTRRDFVKRVAITSGTVMATGMTGWGSVPGLFYGPGDMFDNDLY